MQDKNDETAKTKVETSFCHGDLRKMPVKFQELISERGKVEFLGKELETNEPSDWERETSHQKIEKHREPKNTNSIETKLGGIVRWQNCDAPPCSYPPLK